MNEKEYIPIIQLCDHYSLEVSFFGELHEVGLIELTSVGELQYLHQDSLVEIEKIIRIHSELKINIEGIDAILNLLQKVDDLTAELDRVKNRLSLYE